MPLTHSYPAGYAGYPSREDSLPLEWREGFSISERASGRGQRTVETAGAGLLSFRCHGSIL